MLGEAKASSRPRTSSDLVQLERARELLVRRGVDAGTARLLLFGRSGFDDELRATAGRRSDVQLVDLRRLYEGA